MSDVERIRDLNDRFRRCPCNGLGRFVVTHGVRAKGQDFVAKCVNAVKNFNDFTKDNDPYGEHDFFKFEVDGEELFWKCDYYDRELKYASPNPADPQVTVRIGTIMLTEDY